MISCLLVANRGEIARRVFRSCRAAGITTVAVFSDPDARAPHVAEADRAVRLPGASSDQTYLNGEAIVAAALAAGADAVHPGYGFLAEDPAFARRVLAAGLAWVGPPPEAMEAMALKIEARKRAAAAGVPVLPELDPGSVTRFPVLVKASAGGGGRGMRAVHAASELAEAIESARREAQAAFGDGTVFCEPLLTGARHVEVQVLADQAGTVWALTERDCSVQRRYAKVIEETPSPAVGPELRERLLSGAAALARSVGYVNAGTVEFLVTSGRVWPARRVLLPGVQHQAPGRAPGHRMRAPHRPGRAAAGDRRGAAAARASAGGGRARDRGAPVRRGPGGGIPAVRRSRARARRP